MIDRPALRARYEVLLRMWEANAAFILKNGTTYPVRAKGHRERPGRIIAIKTFPQAASLLPLHRELAKLERELKIGNPQLSLFQ